MNFRSEKSSKRSANRDGKYAREVCGKYKCLETYPPTTVLNLTYLMVIWYHFSSTKSPATQNQRQKGIPLKAKTQGFDLENQPLFPDVCLKNPTPQKAKYPNFRIAELSND